VGLLVREAQEVAGLEQLHHLRLVLLEPLTQAAVVVVEQTQALVLLVA
jgi:hypothetical protein